MRPAALEGMEDALRPTPVLLAGRPQRHVYLTSCRALCARTRPDVAFVEAEPYALAAMQWSRAFAKLGIPFGVQCYENIDRRLPLLDTQAALAGAASGRVRGRSLGQRRAPGAHVGSGGGGCSRPAGGPRLGALAGRLPASESLSRPPPGKLPRSVPSPSAMRAG